MISTDKAHRLHVYVRSSKGKLKKLGRVHATIFHPTELRAIGYAIKRPDALLMVKRSDQFIALDRVEYADQGILADDAPDSWGEKACKRLGVDYDRCVIWENMPVHTESGHDLGTVNDVFFDESTGFVDHIDISASAADKLILGSSDIPQDRILGYRDGAIVVHDTSEGIDEAGGVAAQAGAAWAKTKHAASTEVKKASKKAGDAINDGAYKAGELVGSVREKTKQAAEERAQKKRDAEERGEYTGVDKAANLFGQQLGKASGMFKSFKDEFDKASKG